jgi:hypothetical protein
MADSASGLLMAAGSGDGLINIGCGAGLLTAGFEGLTILAGVDLGAESDLSPAYANLWTEPLAKGF